MLTRLPRRPRSAIILGIAVCVMELGAAFAASAGEAEIRVHAKDVMHELTRYRTGACIEDVNHEIYGGIYSQMIFGESFQEPAAGSPDAIKGFMAYDGDWSAKGGELSVGAGGGPKLVAQRPIISDGEVGVEVFFEKPEGGNAGLILKVTEPACGADGFNGYEIALNPKEKSVCIGRHRHNWELIRNVPCDVPVGRWIPLVVKLKADSFAVLLDGKEVFSHKDQEHPLNSGKVGLRNWRQGAKFRKLWTTSDGKKQALAFADSAPDRVSRQWRPVRQGEARGAFGMETKTPFAGGQSQRIAFLGGVGAVGIENRGLNRWGMYFQEGKSYDGYVWVKTDKPADVFVAMENADGARVYAETALKAVAGDWRRLDFQLTPNGTDKAGRFAIKLKQPGDVAVGHAFLQPGEWGRFKGFPVRKDVAEALVAQGLTVLRYGGSMVNDAPGGYKWKRMIGPRDHRPPYHGTWYPWSSNGWGIVDFLDLCRAANFLAVPTFNMDETPQDMADFIEYANGPADSPWGRRRAADGRAEPYRLKFLELGNEQAVNEDYWRRFKPLAEAVWAKDPDMTIVVGDLYYNETIKDPYNFSGALYIKSLATHRKILELAKRHNREVWFDVHIDTDRPQSGRGLPGVSSFIEALGKICPGAKYKVVIFEFNAGHHDMGRALGNARAINELERIGDRIPIACSANCLQPYRQNDNGWDQGLLFLTPSQVWGQPPYYVTRMVSNHYLPKCVRTEVRSPANALDVTAKTDGKGKVLQLQVVNLEKQPLTADIVLDGFVPTKPTAKRIELQGRLDEVNTPEQPERIVPKTLDWPHGIERGKTSCTFPAYSFTVLRFE